MQTINLKITEITPQLLSYFEKLKLVKRLQPTKKVISIKTKTGAVDTLYTSSPEYGPHKLICVGKRATEIKLGSHPDNEEFILFNTTKFKFKPLIMIIGLQKHEILKNKIKNKTLSQQDFMAVELKFNDPETSIFTMLKNTVHCEVTINSPRKMHPVFFVTEPQFLKTKKFSTGQYKLSLEKKVK